MKIIFFGTGDFSVKILKGLIDLNQEVLAVVSQPDKVNGRNNKVTFSPIKMFCLQNDIPIFQFDKLNKEGEDTLKNFEPDLFITASYGQIIKQNILDIPKFGTVNVHPSLLPKYRGPTPIQTAILNGDKVTGVTLMKTDIGLDTGDIILYKEMQILEEDTSSSVFDKLSTLSIDCLKELFSNFDYYINNATPQDDSKVVMSKMINKQDYLLDFNNNTINLINKIKALENCYFNYLDKRYKILKAVADNLKGNAGEILECSAKTGLIIATKDSSIKVVTIQPEGKSKMDAKSFMNSGKFKKGNVIK